MNNLEPKTYILIGLATVILGGLILLHIRNRQNKL